MQAGNIKPRHFSTATPDTLREYQKKSVVKRNQNVLAAREKAGQLRFSYEKLDRSEKHQFIKDMADHFGIGVRTMYRIIRGK